MSLWCKSEIGFRQKSETRFRHNSGKPCREKRNRKCSSQEKPKSNYAINPTPEQALRTNRAVLPARVIAALGVRNALAGKTAGFDTEICGKD
jgi:hypothetical protein